MSDGKGQWSTTQPRPKRVPKCHPDRKYHARDMCRPCYRDDSRKRYEPAPYVPVVKFNKGALAFKGWGSK